MAALPLDSRHADTDRWVPVDAHIRGSEAIRSPSLLDRIVDQFEVTRRPRYLPSKDTYCNIFVWDVTRALGCEIPHWTLKDGTPAHVGLGSVLTRQKPGIAREMDANGISAWLAVHGQRHGWTPLVTWDAAAAWANEGKPAVAAHRATHGHGHVAIVRPGACLAAAGRECHQRGSLDQIFPPEAALTFWGHP